MTVHFGRLPITAASTSRNRVAIPTVMAALTMLPLASASAQARPRPTTTLRPAECRVRIPDAVKPRVRCYTFLVPRDYDRPADGTFELAVAVKTAEHPDPSQRPILALHGGPGATGWVEAVGQFWQASPPRATIVIFDQRGMGLSAPREVCGDIRSTFTEAFVGPGDAFTTAWRSQEPMARCRARLHAAGIRAEHFGTRITSRDAEELRRALGIPMWDLYSVSYGTTVARDLLGAYPASVGSVLLDSPVTAHEVSAAGEERTDWTMRNIFAACAADSACASAHPDFESRFLETFDSVEARHLLVPIRATGSGDVTIADINGAEFDYVVRRLRRNVQTMRLIPRAMEAARKRDVEALSPIVPLALAGHSGPTEAPGRPSIACRDGAYFHTPTIPRTSLQLTTTMFCGVWGAPGLPPRMPIEGRSRVLVMVGGLDMLVEESFLQQLRASLRQQMQLVTFPALGHGVTASDCAKRIAVAFYANPAAPIDTRCVEPRPRIVFDP